MSAPTLAELAARLRHTHDHGASVASHESKTRWVVVLTLGMMVGELAVGYATHSMALTADGWHMATHAGALGMAAFAYWFARTRARATSFSFGTGKVHALAGYTSAVVLAMIAIWMFAESAHRLFRPEAIAFREALPVAVLGLAVNIVSAFLLQHDHEHEHEDHHDENHDDHGNDAHEHDGHHDHNLRAAYVHVLADAFTSVLAIAALLGGRYFGWTFLDAAMGIVGGVVIARWSYGLCRGAARQLLDVVPSAATSEKVRAALEADGRTHVSDLHVWELGPRARACIASVVTHDRADPGAFRKLILGVDDFAHVTVEVHRADSSATSP
jgi:cation diffusion facilitator family transporter